MSALRKILAGGVAVAALVSAAPAMAQYYPGNGSPYGYGGGDIVGQIIGQVLGGGYGGAGYGGYGGGYGGYGGGINSQAVVSQCVGAVQQRLSGGYGGGYGYNQNAYNGGYTGARVLGISRVEPNSGGGLTVRGAASSGRSAGYNYGGQAAVDLTFRCSADYRGTITNVDVRRAQPNYGYNTQSNGYGQSNGYNYGATPYGTDYSQYGYSRY